MRYVLRKLSVVVKPLCPSWNEDTIFSLTNQTEPADKSRFPFCLRWMIMFKISWPMIPITCRLCCKAADTRSHHLYLAQRANLPLADIQVVGRRVARARFLEARSCPAGDGMIKIRIIQLQSSGGRRLSQAKLSPLHSDTTKTQVPLRARLGFFIGRFSKEPFMRRRGRR